MRILILIAFLIAFVLAAVSMPLVGSGSLDAGPVFKQYVVVVEGTGIPRAEFKLKNWAVFANPEDQLFYLIPQAVQYLQKYQPVYPVPRDEDKDVR